MARITPRALWTGTPRNGTPWNTTPRNRRPRSDTSRNDTRRKDVSGNTRRRRPRPAVTCPGPHPGSAADRCDRCGAQAYLRVV
ncbi:DUF7455 domain-containing protein, partial [Streptomyces sp. CB01580]|uniref:DUF7455 domain-containing protein n=1 Tax=Streptomyces sp. CB01580 TaxID=1703933 RepID=UPI003FD0F48F